MSHMYIHVIHQSNERPVKTKLRGNLTKVLLPLRGLTIQQLVPMWQQHHRCMRIAQVSKSNQQMKG